MTSLESTTEDATAESIDGHEWKTDGRSLAHGGTVADELEQYRRWKADWRNV